MREQFAGIRRTRFGRLAARSLHVATVAFFLAPTLSLPCHAGDIVFIGTPEDLRAEPRELEVASQFYGVRLNVVTPTADGRQLDLRRAVEQNTTVGVAIAATLSPALITTSFSRC